MLGAFVSSGSIDLLKLLISVVCREADHIHDEVIQKSLVAFIRRYNIQIKGLLIPLAESNFKRKNTLKGIRKQIPGSNCSECYCNHSCNLRCRGKCKCKCQCKYQCKCKGKYKYKYNCKCKCKCWFKCKYICKFRWKCRHKYKCKYRYKYKYKLVEMQVQVQMQGPV